MTGDVVAGGALLGLGAAHLLYTYVGYPWVVSVLPARAPRVGSASPRLVSVVIAARGGVAGAGRAEMVAAKVQDLLRTIRLPFEIIVVLDQPDAAVTAALAGLDDQRVRVGVLRTGRGKAAALNRGVAMAQGDVLVFTDVRQRVAAGAVEELAAALASPDVGVVSGSLAIASEAGSPGLYDRYWRFERWLRQREADWDSSVGVTGALYALKWELWRPLPDNLLLDDVWVPLQVVRAGKRVAFAPRAVATDVGSGSDATELARKVRTLTGNYQLIAWMPSLLHPGKNRIWWQFVSHKVLRLVTPIAVGCLVAGGLLVSGHWASVGSALGVLGLALAWAVRHTRAMVLPGLGRLAMVRSGLALFAALVVAALNAARGRWDVWGDPPRPTFANPQQS